jgi:hypothetical protein
MPLKMRPTGLGHGVYKERRLRRVLRRMGSWPHHGAIIALATGQGGDDNVVPIRMGINAIRSLSPHDRRLSGKKKPRRAGPSRKSDTA